MTPGKPNPLEAHSGPNRGTWRFTVIAVLVVALVFGCLVVWASID